MQDNLPLKNYGIDDKPPFFSSLLLTLQFLVKFGEMLACPLLLARITNSSSEGMISIMSMSLITAAIITFAQAWKRIGPGYLSPSNSAVQYFAATLAAAKIGGMAMVAGMLVISGLFQLLLTPIFRLFKKVLTPNVAGFIVVMMSMWLGGIGVRELFQPNQLGQLMVHSTFSTALVKQSVDYRVTFLAGISLFIMLGLRFWSPTKLRAYSLLIGIAFGWIINTMMGWVPNQLSTIIAQSHWFAWIHYHYYGFDFSWNLMPAFLLAGFISLKTVFAMYGSIQTVNYPKHKKIDLKKIRHANIVAGSGIVLGGILGAYPQNMEPGIAATQHAVGVFSRYIGFFVAAFTFLLAFSPKIQMFFLTMPAAINGAALLYFAAIFLVTGLEMLNIKKMESWEMQALALSLAIGSSLDIIPAFYKSHILSNLEVTTPALSASVIAYIILRSLFSIKKSKIEEDE